MVSWDYHDERPDDMPDLYQQRIDQRVREDMLSVTAVPDGYRRPPLEMCRLHRYGVVDGLCGVCIELLRADRRAA